MQHHEVEEYRCGQRVESGTTTLGAEDSASRRMIAMVDDSPTMRKLVAVALGRVGFDVVGYGDGIALLRWLHEEELRVPDLILLDIGLPRMNGYQVAYALKRHPRASRCPIIVVSRRNGLWDQLKARLAGASDYLVKPFTTQGLVSSVCALVCASNTQSR